MLGMTEAGSVCLASDDEGDQPEHRRGSFGRAGARLRGEESSTPTPATSADGEVGELWFRGPFLMEGYYGRERHETFTPTAGTAPATCVDVDDDGFFYFTGRRGDMIKTAGANVSPREVEAAIADVSGLVAHVVGHRRRRRAASSSPPRCVCPRDRRSTSTSCADALPRAAVGVQGAAAVSSRCADAEVPMLSSGKLDARALKERFGARLNG